MELYSGTWWSTKYTAAFSRGNVWVSLKSGNQSETYHSDAKIKYLGMYRLRQEETISIAISPQGAESKEFVTPPAKVQGKTAPSGKGELTFKIEKQQGDTIEGTYTLSNPFDKGGFKLQKGPDHVEQCAIM